MQPTATAAAAAVSAPCRRLCSSILHSIRPLLSPPRPPFMAAHAGEDHSSGTPKMDAMVETPGKCGLGWSACVSRSSPLTLPAITSSALLTCSPPTGPPTELLQAWRKWPAAARGTACSWAAPGRVSGGRQGGWVAASLPCPWSCSCSAQCSVAYCPDHVVVHTPESAGSRGSHPSRHAPPQERLAPRLSHQPPLHSQPTRPTPATPTPPTPTVLHSSGPTTVGGTPRFTCSGMLLQGGSSERGPRRAERT